jgi:hypothetical protein
VGEVAAGEAAEQGVRVHVLGRNPLGQRVWSVQTSRSFCAMSVPASDW